jgi:hypothetical protein
MSFTDYINEVLARLQTNVMRLRRGMLARLIAALFHRIAGKTR